jgi:hypothetical protein
MLNQALPHAACEDSPYELPLQQGEASTLTHHT